MKMIKTTAAIGLLSCALTQGAMAAEPASCKQVRFAEIGWADIAATTGVAMTLVEGLGYQPRKIMASVPIAFTGVKSGQVDVFLGYWAPSMDSVIEPFLKDDGVKVLPKANLEGAKYTLAVPTYAAEAGLKSFQDIAKFKDQLGGKIYGIEPGNDGNLLIDGMIKNNQFDLGDFRMVESSEAGMLVQVSRAIRKKEPVVFLGWAPHPMNTQHDITYLSGGDDVFWPRLRRGQGLHRCAAGLRGALRERRQAAEQPAVHRRYRKPTDGKGPGKGKPAERRQGVDQGQPGDPRPVAERRDHL